MTKQNTTNQSANAQWKKGIEWKKLSEEKPVKNTPIIIEYDIKCYTVRKSGYSLRSGYHVVEYVKVKEGIDKGKMKFLRCETFYIANNITHWAYINKPKE